MSITHHFVVVPDTDHLERLAEYRPVTDEDREDSVRWHIECSDPAACPAWAECRKPHEVDGVSAADGPWDAPDGAPWDGLDEFTFHGEPHEWRSGYGWTVDYAGCAAIEADTDPPDGLHPLRPGRWEVDTDWDDTSCYLTLITPRDEGLTR